MKVIFLLGIGRSGVDLIQSLFDKHKEVSQFPGYFSWLNFIKKIENINDPENIAREFIKNYLHFFDSRLNFYERHNQLGKNKKLFYLVNKEKFIKNFIYLLKNKKINNVNIFQSLHLAYSLANRENIKKKKIIVLNLHKYEDFFVLNNFKIEVIFMMRHPIAVASSSIKHWLNYKSGKFTSPWQVYFFLEKIFFLLKKLKNKKIPIHVIKLESLHKNTKKIMIQLSRKIKISYSNVLLQSTYHGKKWWGDSLSGKYLDGINPEFKNLIDTKFFFKKDLILFEYFLKEIFKKYLYPIKIKRLNKFIYELLKVFPLKMELIVLKREILNFNIKNILFFFYYWVKRIKLMNKNIYKNVYLPRDIRIT